MTDLSSSEGVVLDNSKPNDQSEEPFVNNADKGDKSQEKSPDLQQDSDVAQGKETDVRLTFLFYLEEFMCATVPYHF